MNHFGFLTIGQRYFFCFAKLLWNEFVDSSHKVGVHACSPCWLAWQLGICSGDGGIDVLNVLSLNPLLPNFRTLELFLSWIKSLSSKVKNTQTFSFHQNLTEDRHHVSSCHQSPEMEKAYKIAHSKLWVWKISSQNMCKKMP